jgi:hypothetical protein
MPLKNQSAKRLTDTDWFIELLRRINNSTRFPPDLMRQWSLICHRLGGYVQHKHHIDSTAHGMIIVVSTSYFDRNAF